MHNCSSNFCGGRITAAQENKMRPGNLVRPRGLCPWLCFIFNHSSISKVFYQKRRKSNKCLRIPSHGTLRWSWTSACPLQNVLVHVLGHSTWEPPHQAVNTDPLIHITVYFNLFNFCLADICSISTTVPRMVMDIPFIAELSPMWAA